MVCRTVHPTLRRKHGKKSAPFISYSAVTAKENMGSIEWMDPFNLHSIMYNSSAAMHLMKRLYSRLLIH